MTDDLIARLRRAAEASPGDPEAWRRYRAECSRTYDPEGLGARIRDLAHRVYLASHRWELLAEALEEAEGQTLATEGDRPLTLALARIEALRRLTSRASAIRVTLRGRLIRMNSGRETWPDWPRLSHTHETQVIRGLDEANAYLAYQVECRQVRRPAKAFRVWRPHG